MAEDKTKAGERKVLAVYQSEKDGSREEGKHENWGEVLLD